MPLDKNIDSKHLQRDVIGTTKTQGLGKTTKVYDTAYIYCPMSAKGQRVNDNIENLSVKIRVQVHFLT